MTGQELLQYNIDLNMQGVATDPDWIALTIQEGVLYEKWGKMLSEDKECLEACFGDDCDLHIKILEERSRTVTKYNWINYPYQETTIAWDVVFCPILHFKEFTITNTARHTHIIRDLYVSIDITFDFVTKKFKLENISGTRMTATSDEIDSGYLQSHLGSSYSIDHFSSFPYHHSTDKCIWKSFCLGNGEILDLLVELQNNFDCDIFQLLLFHIQTMVKWESTEGNPFIAMNRVAARRSLIPVDYNTCVRYYENMLKPAMQAWEPKKEVKIVYDETSGSFLIADDNQLEEFVKFSNNISDYNNICNVTGSVACVKDSSNNTCSFSTATSSRSVRVTTDHLNNKLVFRKQLVPFVIHRQDSNTENLQFFLHPQIKNYVKSKLQQDLTEKIFRYSAIEACY